MAYEYQPGRLTDQSTGSAISAGNQTIFTIRNNAIENVSRHSIYISSDTAGNSYLIEGNIIKNHRNTGLGVVVSDVLSAAIVIARTFNATVSNNTIIGSHAIGISVERAGGNDYSTNPPQQVILDSGDVYLTNNVFSDSAKADIWISALGPVYLSGNRSGSSGASCVSGDTAIDPCHGSNIHFSSAMSFSRLANAFPLFGMMSLSIH